MTYSLKHQPRAPMARRRAKAQHTACALALFCEIGARLAVILLDWSGVDLTPKSTPYAEEAVELQDSNMTLDQIYTINSKS